MNLIGKIIKAGLQLKGGLSAPSENVIDQQKSQLEFILDAARNTAIGKYYGFEKIVHSDDIIRSFQKAMPIHDYKSIRNDWWKQQKKLPDITWPGMQSYYALSSGTTGKKSKQIPVTESFLQSMQQVGMAQMVALSKMDLPPEVFESEALAISSSAQLEETDGFQMGEISGINVSNLPDWYDLFFRPGKEIAKIKDWEERTDRIAALAPEWNIGIISGIPSWVQMCLKKIIETHKLESINDIWPNAQVFISGGVAFNTYDKSFRALFDKDLHVVDTYLASEGFIAYGTDPNDLSMTLATNHGIFFEFVPFNGKNFKNGKMIKKPQVLDLSEVEVGQEYALLITNCSGLYRYIIGDVVKFTSFDPPKLKITGRTKFFLNVVGSQLSEEKLDAAIDFIDEKYNLDINEYSVSCREIDGRYVHHWLLISNEQMDTDSVAKDMDQYLKEVNKNYHVARNKTLDGVKVCTMTKPEYNNYLRKKKKLGGQIKIEKVMDPKKFEEVIGVSK